MPKSFQIRLLPATVAVLTFLAAACSSGSGSNTATPEPSPTEDTITQPSGQATTLPVISATTTAQELSPDRIQYTSNVSTRYYTVTGTTTADIFDSIDRNGPRDPRGVKGSGLAAATWDYRFQPQNSPDGCVIASMTISLDIVVTLPRHQNESSLSQALQTKWDAFEAGVAKHEQTHVDIDQAGARTIRDKMTAIKPAANCDALGRQVDQLWNTEQRAIENAQSQFHAQEDARIAALRAPLQSVIDGNRDRIESLNNQIKSLDGQLSSMNTELTNVDNQLNALDAQIDAILASHPGGNLPADVFAKYEELRRLYNALAPHYNALVAQYNSSINERNAVAEDHDELVDSTNVLVEQFNWTR